MAFPGLAEHANIGGQEVEVGTLESMGAMERMPLAGVRTVVADGEQLLVSACGRTCQVDYASAISLERLQLFLQRTLQMDGQEFQVCDINGNILTTDAQVQEVIAQGLTPLCATLPDKSLHQLENRREEIAQMQWKLVRDQITNSGHQFSSLARQLSELQLQFQTFQREVQTSFETMQSDTVRALQEERQATKSETYSLQEGVNGVAVLINAERNKRELAVQGFEKHIHGVCDMIDNERIARRQELSAQTSTMDEFKVFAESEKTSREKTDKYVGDIKAELWQLKEDVIASTHDLREQIERVRDLEHSAGFDILARFTQIEDRYTSLESSVDSVSNFCTQSVDNLAERQERISQSSETLRLSFKSLEGAVERIKEMENSVKQNYAGIHERFGQEKTAREDALRRISQTATSDARKMMGDLEKRLTIRLERESADREKNFKTMIDEVSNIVDDRKLFRDQLITKTIKVSDPSLAPTLPTRFSGPTTSYSPVGITATPSEAIFVEQGINDSMSTRSMNEYDLGPKDASFTVAQGVNPQVTMVSTPTIGSPMTDLNSQQRQVVLSATTGGIASMVSANVFGSMSNGSLPLAASASPRMASPRPMSTTSSTRFPITVSTGASTPRSDSHPFAQQIKYLRSQSPVGMMARNGATSPYKVTSYSRSSSPLPAASFAYCAPKPVD
jgi:hypothetical protein